MGMSYEELKAEVRRLGAMAPAHPTEPAKPQHVAREAGQPVGYCGKTYKTVLGGFTCNRTDLHGDDRCAWNWERWTPKQPAPAAIPAAPKVERAGCELYCGMTVSTLWLLPHGDPVERSWRLHRDTVGDGTRYWCSRSCMGAALPPLSAPKAIEAAKPATPLCCNRMAGGNTCEVCGRSAPGAAKPVAVEQAKCCQRCGKTGGPIDRYPFDGKAYLWCEPCQMQSLKWGDAQSGASYLRDTKRPALIDRRLSHSFGIEDPALEDA